MNAEMINDRQKVYNINNTDNNKDNNNKNNSFRHLNQRANNNNNNNNNYSKSSSSSSGGGRDKFSVTNSFRRYTCQQCDKIFTDPSVLHHHFRSAHSSSRSHSCPECSKNFASSSGLKQHQHIHQSVKPFRCEVCLKAYTQFSNLCRHKRMHADCRQQIKCLDCGQAFSTLMSLNKHRRFCEGVMRRHSTTGAGLNPASCFLPLPGLDGAGSIVAPGAAAAASALQAIHPSLGALESWCMHLYGCRPSAFPVCPPAGYMACLPPFPSQQSILAAAAAAAAQSSPLLLGSYMGLLPLQEELEDGQQPSRKEDSASSLIRRPSSSASSSAEKRRRSRERKAVNHREGQSSVTTHSAYEPPKPEVERQETWPLEDLGRSVKKEKEEEVKEEEELTKETSVEDEVDRKSLHSPSEGSHPERKTSVSPLIRTPSPNDTGSGEDQQPLDLSTKSRAEVKSPLTGTSTFTSRLDTPTSSSTSRSRSATFEDSLRRPAGNEVKHPPPSKHPRYSLEPSSFVPGTGFLSSVYHLRKDLLASYAGRNSSTVHPNGTYQLTTARPELDNIRGFVGKADHGLQSTLLSPLVRLPDILSFKSTKPRYRYSCRYCGKVFPRSANLTRHLRTHTGEQPYRCKYCKRCFSISSNLQRHVRNIHNKEKPFRCPLCERCFGQQTNLDRHVKKHDTDSCTGGGETSSCFPSGSGYPGAAAAGSRGPGTHHDVKGVQGMGQDEPYFKEIQNYFANTSSSSSSFYLGRVEGQVDEVTGSDEKEEAEEEEVVDGEGVAREGKVEVKTEACCEVDDTLQ